MNKLLFAFVLLASSCNITTPNPEIAGRVQNPSYQNGKVTFQLNGGTFTTICQPNQFEQLKTDKNVIIRFSSDYTQIRDIVPYKAVWKLFVLWGFIFAALLLCVFVLGMVWKVKP